MQPKSLHCAVTFPYFLKKKSSPFSFAINSITKKEMNILTTTAMVVLYLEVKDFNYYVDSLKVLRDKVSISDMFSLLSERTNKLTCF